MRYILMVNKFGEAHLHGWDSSTLEEAKDRAETLLKVHSSTVVTVYSIDSVGALRNVSSGRSGGVVWEDSK